MIYFDNASYLAQRAFQLRSSPKGAVGRSIRRFLKETCDDVRAGEHHLVLTFARFDDGFTDQQLRALHKAAEHVLQESTAAFQGLPLEPGFIVFDEAFGTLALYFKLTVGLDNGSRLEPGSVSQLKDVLHAVQWLTAMAHEHLEPGHQTGLCECPDYAYRGLPCNVVAQEDLWAVAGADSRGGAGVLEWCVSAEDAQERMALMMRQPNRFSGLSAVSWKDLNAETSVAA